MSHRPGNKLLAVFTTVIVRKGRKKEKKHGNEGLRGWRQEVCL